MESNVAEPESHLAYEAHGDGPPVVFLHGLTFDRTTWRPIIERLDPTRVHSVAVDLPGHGETGGGPCGLARAAARVHALVTELELAPPIVVGHSMSAGIAGIYAASYHARGMVDVDGGVDLRPFAGLVRRLAPALRGDDFGAAFQPFQQSMGLDLVPEPGRSLVSASQAVDQRTVLGYWEEAMSSDPAELQARVEAGLRSVDTPYLGMFGHRLSAQEREYLLALLPQAELVEEEGGGHFLHLADPDRFAARLAAFIDDCASGAAPGRRTGGLRRVEGDRATTAPTAASPRQGASRPVTRPVRRLSVKPII
jgi:pimeloyl-ACP methyl ester carboxylesterase